MLDSIYHMTFKIIFVIGFWCENVVMGNMQRCYGHHFITLHVPENL